MRRPTWGALAATLIIAGLFTARGAEGKTKAAELFEKGRKALDAGDFATACGLFQQSFELEAKASPMLSLAECEGKRGALVKSLAHWQRGLDMLDAKDPRRDIAQTNLEAIKKRLGRIAVVWSRNRPENAKAFVEAEAAVLGGEPVLVDPGKHKITATTPDGQPRVIEVDVAEGELKSVDVTPPEVQAAKPISKPEAPPPPSNSGLRTAGFVSLGVGAASAIGFGITSALFLDKKGAVDKECPGRACTTDAGYAAAQDGKTIGVVNAVTLVAAGVGVGLGVTLLVMSAPSTKKPSEVGLVVGPNGVVLRGSLP